MKRRLYSRAAIVVCVLMVCAAAVAVAGRHAKTSQTQHQQAARLLVKAATPGRLDKLGNGEADRSGLVTPAAEDYANRAYPNSTIDFAQTQTSMKDAKKVLKHTGAKLPKPWEAIGPDTLNVDTLGTQTFGIPTQWSGRISALAVELVSRLRRRRRRRRLAIRERPVFESELAAGL